jgi:hypothetical protein
MILGRVLVERSLMEQRYQAVLEVQAGVPGRGRRGAVRGVPARLVPPIPQPVVAESLLDRLINTSHQLLLDRPSYRPRNRPLDRR